MKKLILIIMTMLSAYTMSIGALPDKIYAPYVDVMLWPTFDLISAYEATGQKYYTLAFIISGTDGGPAWGGSLAMSSDHMLDQIESLRAVGGDVIISFGGANGTPIASTITDVSSLVDAYETVIDKYDISWIDFDVEGYWVSDAASIARRNEAAAILQSNHPDLRITYCLPVMPTGLTADGVSVINDAVAAGVDIYGVNVMAMDYGQSNSAMGTAAINAAENTHSQTGLNVGITPMIGQNDTQNEIFSLSNAQEVYNFANSTSWVNMLAMWSVNRDNGDCSGQTTASATCSGLSQSQYDFVNVFKGFSGESSDNDDDDDDDDSQDTSDYISWESYNIADNLIRHQDSRGRIDSSVSPENDGNWIMVTGLAGTGVSFQSVNYPDRYLRHRNGEIWLDTYDGTTLFDEDATFIVTNGLADESFYSFQSYNYPTHYIRHKNSLLYAEEISSDLDKNDATFIKHGDATLPGTFSMQIEAEDYSSMSGVESETTTDTDGGESVGYIDTGDWMAYSSISIPESGTYTVQFRVASESTGGQLTLDVNAGATVLATVDVPVTGGWQTWETVSSTFTLDAGTYDFGIYAQSGGWNLNWWKITQTSTSSNDNDTTEEDDTEENDDTTSGETGSMVTGEMTFYGPESGFPTDVPSNAGGYTADDLLASGMNFCAMQTTNLMNDQLMGGCIEVTSPSGSKEKFLIVDKLPSGSAGDVDIYGQEVFGLMEDPDLGRVDVQWQIVALPTSGNVQYRFQSGSNEWWAALQIFNHTYPIQKVEYLDASGSYVEMARQSDGGNFFIASGMGTGPYTIRLTDYFGNVIVHEGVEMQSTYRQEMDSNFGSARKASTISDDLMTSESVQFTNYPNPVATSTTFTYSVQETSQVQLALYNSNGKKVVTLFNGRQEAGTYNQTLDVSSLENGIYIARILKEGTIATLKVVVNK